MFSAVYVGTHLLFWQTAADYFGSDGPREKASLLSAFLFLAAAFPTSLLFTRLVSGGFFRWLYLGSSFWISVAFHLVFLVGMYWGLRGILSAFGASADIRPLVPLITVLGVALAIAGTWRAYRPVVTPVQVSIRNLPPSWTGKKAVHLSDVHLGAAHGRRFLKRVIDKVTEIEPDLVLITGDLFDNTCTTCSRFTEALKNLKAERGVYFVTGNHEGYLGLEKPLEALRGTSIQVLDDETVEVDGLRIVGMSYPEYRRSGEPTNPLEDLGPAADSPPTILLFHTPTTADVDYSNLSVQQMKTYYAPDTDLRYAVGRGVDLQLSGHVHGGQIFPLSLFAKRMFKGFHSGLHSFGDFSLLVSCGTGTAGPPLRSAGRSEIVAITLRSKPDPTESPVAVGGRAPFGGIGRRIRVV
ncbi:MAG: metallophosphoesterase [Planctomycetota bacterium]|jgi:predicted MPP superfamily phosphohydrolase